MCVKQRVMLHVLVQCFNLNLLMKNKNKSFITIICF